MNTKTKKKFDLYETVTNRIIAELEKGTVPWRKTWGNVGPARNYDTGVPYKGINALLLSLTPHPVPCFLTLRQVNRLGGKVKKGSKGHQVVYYSTVYRDGNGKRIPKERISSVPKDELQTRRFIKYYYLFNVEDIDGIRFSYPDFKLRENNPIERCERLIRDMPSKPKFVSKDSRRCYYNPATDELNMPPMGHFESSENYYNTLWHELIHATGHPSRLNRPTLNEIGRFGDRTYSVEELVAEIGAAFLCAHTGIDRLDIQENQASYIAGWLSKLRNDKRFIFKAAAEAQKGVDYIIDAKYN